MGQLLGDENANLSRDIVSASDLYMRQTLKDSDDSRVRGQDIFPQDITCLYHTAYCVVRREGLADENGLWTVQIYVPYKMYR